MADVDVLIVTDDFDGGFLQWTSEVPDRSFHLGEFLRVLNDTNWLGFDLKPTLAHRDAPGGGLTAQQIKDRTGADVVGFRFDESFQVDGQARTIDDYDIILFFSINSFEPDDAQLDLEAEAIAKFMENGGGFFATGDHEDLGFPLCHRIPRVRSMRRWWSPAGPNGEPEAPPAIGANRHDTTRPGADGVYNFEDQSDEVPQPIDIAWYGAGFGVVGGYPATFSLPHPLLCSPDGAIKVLPDHMHEGQCEVPDNLAGRTFTLSGQSKREYPDYQGAPLAPEVIAEGTVVPGHDIPGLIDEHDFGDIGITAAARFGVIGVWDGHRVGRGRVVVDSTWHHFFNINVTGDLFMTGDVPASDQRLHGFFTLQNGQRQPNAAYRMIMHYYRNIIYWLIPTKKKKAVWWGSIADIGKTPVLKEQLKPWLGKMAKADGGKVATRKFNFGLGEFDHWYHFGSLADTYFTQIRGACSKAKVREFLYKPKIPWWEWIMDFGDPWDPVIKRRPPEIDQFHRYGAYGLAPRVDPVLRAGLGVAVMLAARASYGQRRGRLTEGQVRELEEAWAAAVPQVTAVARAQLVAGARLGQAFDKALNTRAVKT